MVTGRRRVHLERLRAAYQATGLTWHRLAKRARVSHPTISRLLSGRTRELNAATFTRLARELRVPAGWLTGEQRELPHVPEWGPGQRKGEGPSLWERPTAIVVRYSRLMQSIEGAIRRDLSEWFGDSGGDAYDSWGRGLLTVFSEMSSSVVWRTAWLEPSPKGSWYAVMDSDDSPPMDWLEHILEPWLAGTAYLHPDDVLRPVFVALLANPERSWGSDIRDADALRALDSYAAEMKKHAPRDEPEPVDE